MDAVPGAGQGDGERTRRAAHVEQLLARIEREEVHEPVLILAGREACECCGSFVPIGSRVAVDCVHLFASGARHC